MAPQFIQKFPYQKIKRVDSPNGRQYQTPDGLAVGSVTTILDRTKSVEKQQALQNWRKRVGVKQAAEITKEAAGRGTLMHDFLERYLKGENITAGSNHIHQQGFKMAHEIINNFLDPWLTNVYGMEVGMYYSGLYAGTTDLVADLNGELAICDFKQTNKPKKKEWIDDYFMQLCAYAMAHNHIYGTDIKKAAVLMCSVSLEPQSFIIEGDEFEHWCEQWWLRVAQYYQVKI